MLEFNLQTPPLIKRPKETHFSHKPENKNSSPLFAHDKWLPFFLTKKSMAHYSLWQRYVIGAVWQNAHSTIQKTPRRWPGKRTGGYFNL